MSSEGLNRPGSHFWRGRDGGLDMRGENARGSKLSRAEVVEIKRTLAAGRTSLTTLSVQYGVSKRAIARIRDGSTWSHVTGDGS